MACMCGDLYCGSCGPAQGNWKCSACGKWSTDGPCKNSEECARIIEAINADEEKYLRAAKEGGEDNELPTYNDLRYGH